MTTPNLKNAADDTTGTKTACVFCNGEIKDIEYAGATCRASNLVIAADGGSRHLAVLGIKPDLIIGDMDSLPADLPWDDNDAPRMKYPTDKDKSDAELAVDYAFKQKCVSVTLMGAMGGRLDHALCNIAIVAAHPGRVYITDGGYRLEAVDDTNELVLRGRAGGIVSLIPYGASTAKVTAVGLKYPLNGEPIGYATHGLSNQITADEANIKVSGGIILVFSQSDAARIYPEKKP